MIKFFFFLQIGRKEVFYLTTHSTHFKYGYIGIPSWENSYVQPSCHPSVRVCLSFVGFFKLVLSGVCYFPTQIDRDANKRNTGLANLYHQAQLYQLLCCMREQTRPLFHNKMYVFFVYTRHYLVPIK